MSRSSGSRKSRRRQLRASHQKRWLTGRYAVLETLRAARWPIDELFVANDLPVADRQDVERLVQNSATVLQSVSRDRLAELCDSTHHQGFVAGMADFPYLMVDQLLPVASADTGPQPLLVICDRIQDSFNFGAILRCCDAMNVSGVVIGDSQQAAVTPQVARSSAGAVNHVPIALCNDLASAVEQLQTAGFVIAAASEKSEAPAWDRVLTSPIALIIGSEAEGIADQLRQRCDQHLRIPMLGQVASLNAAVAAGILLYEIRRQQRSIR